MSSSKKERNISVLSHAYSSLLEELGYKIDRAFDDQIHFRADEYFYRFVFDSKKADFVRVDLGVHIAYDESEKLKVFEVVNSANIDFAVVKSSLDSESIDFSCEAWIEERERVGEFVRNSIKAIDEALDQVYKELRDIFNRE